MTDDQPNVLNELISNPDQCAELQLEPWHTVWMRWDADDERLETVEKVDEQFTERKKPTPHKAIEMINDGDLNVWHPVEYFWATCCPEDRPEVRPTQ
jgi:hypothetical protein